MNVDLASPVSRHAGNPILTCHDVNRVWKSPALQVTTVHNAGIAEHGGEVVMLFRSHLRSGVSVLGLARSADGLGGWRVDAAPAMLPCSADDLFAEGVDRQALCEDEAGGVEDPRITLIGDTWYVTYSAYHGSIKDPARVSLATPTDCPRLVRPRPLIDRDCRTLGLLHAPVVVSFASPLPPPNSAAGDVGGTFAEIRLGTTDRIESGDWVLDDEPILRTGGGPSCFSDKIGPGAPPIRTRHGWLNIFHGVRSTMDGNPYCLGVALHDLEDPRRVEAAAVPILQPSRADCRVDETDYVHVPNVVFTCGALRRDDGTILLYYGGNDTVMNVAFSHEDVLADLCRKLPMDPLTGRAMYDLHPGR